jgi:hypothetical protein
VVMQGVDGSTNVFVKKGDVDIQVNQIWNNAIIGIISFFLVFAFRPVDREEDHVI